MLNRTLTLVLATSLAAACAAPSGGTSTSNAPAPAAIDQVYYVYVGAESADLIHRVRLGPDGLSVERTIPVGEIPVETEGPHGLAVAPDGRHLYMTTAHGVPDGKLWKFEMGSDTLVAAPILLGNFPATLDLTPDGLYAFIVNFNLHGEHVPSTVSVVYTPNMVEVDQIPTCTMPHGMRLSPDGLHAYSMCMMDDQLVEVDTRTFEVSRRFSVSQGSEQALHDYPEPEVMTGARGMRAMPSTGGSMGGMDHDHPAMEPTCSPTWAEPSPDGSRVYVACNRSNEILVIDREGWRLEARFPTGAGPYNLDVTPDGRVLVASLKGAGRVQFFDTGTFESLANLPSSTTVTHGVVVTPDSRYAFVSVEGKGAEPGKVDAFDLRTFERVGSVEVGQQAGGIAFWKMEPAG
ncbi:MAG: YncE family protein [Gemmatimonadota bacterium]